ncbi:A/G-specific adenine glycosylase [Azoarcus sp. L1K30]|uniref:A/G-specific adenine glycosylase n=1 Tax=Azoarcus sp. L1K30 TaxID=2820277 RepID=UPI001B837E82|nr:A/G-specific adenine glycosylase [Azoarcus sp. L1K30]MBR0566779.1 A/G-specific adenine glycosylase [Azoarcus sp. L1K30]
MSDFARRLIEWQRHHGRHDLPWQGGHDPYRIWLSEIMLQQTQVSTVIPYYTRFIERFPDVASLAAAPVDEVMTLWSGLGYYARARNLHRAAQQVMREHGGTFPRSAAQIVTLPGIGRSTAAAIAAFSSAERVAILDGNVKRVLCRVFGIEGFPGEKAVESRLWTLAESLLPNDSIGRYIQAQMDLGATVCTRGKPACERCPLADECLARLGNRIASLPSPRPRRAVPRRSVRVAVIVDRDAVLLERRPPTGIWGGLLSLPEVPEHETELSAWVHSHLGLETRPGIQLPPLTHTFTHFILDMQPWRLELTAQPARACDGNGMQWLPLSDTASAALPTPVRTILERMAMQDLLAAGG